MVELVERDSQAVSEERDSEPWKPVGHHVWRKGDRVAMCGAPVLGIKAFGDFTVCPRCAELRAAQDRLRTRPSG